MRIPTHAASAPAKRRDRLAWIPRSGDRAVAAPVAVECYRFGRFELQPAQRRLLSEGRQLSLGGRALDLLIALVERSGNLVGKDELFARVWPKLVVEENSLHAQMSTLRKVLGPGAIET